MIYFSICVTVGRIKYTNVTCLGALDLINNIFFKEYTYVTCNVDRSILVNIHRYHSCIDRVPDIWHRKAIARNAIQSNQHHNDICQVHNDHDHRNPGCIMLQKDKKIELTIYIEMTVTKLL